MTPGAKDRYSRQIRFSGFREAGQQRLFDATAAIVGCGALGSFQAAAMARAGVGKLILIDRDFVEVSNLPRQWLYDEADAADALPKAIAAKRQLQRIASECGVTAHVADLTPDNIEELLEGADLILDGTDNFETRYLVNDYAVQERVPWIYGGAVGSYGIVMAMIPEETCCFRCIYPDPPQGAQPTCETAGVVNVITSLVGSWQTAEALKLLSGATASPYITTADLWTGQVRQIRRPAREPACPACGKRDFVYLQGLRRAPVSLCGRNAVQIHERARPIDLAALQTQLDPLGEVRRNEFALRFFLPEYELTVFPDGRAIVKGTTEPGIAKSIYARYVGA